MRVTLRLFGEFRKFGDGSELEVEVSGAPSLAGLRRALAEKLEAQAPGQGAAALVADSAFATDAGLLDEAADLAEGASVAVLPPVCGG